MATKKSVADLSRPSVKVEVETIKIGMAELAYLRALTQPKKLRCHPSQKVLDKLRFLDLIARANIQPAPEEMSAWTGKAEELERSVSAAFKSRDWDALGDAANKLHWHVRSEKPKATEDDILTEKGKFLLAEGNATVRVRKVGCVE